MNMKKIGLIYGGRSTEHDGSVETKKGVMSGVNQEIYPVVDLIFIDRENNVFLNEKEISLGTLVDRIKSNQDVFYFNLMPGNEGEDGAWSGLFEICDGRGSFESVNTASILMNKYQQSEIATILLPEIAFCPKSALLQRGMDSAKIEKIIDGFDTEIFIKPNSMGSSHFMDTFMPSEKARIKEFLVKLFEYDQAAIVQEFIEGDNYSCGVFRGETGQKALPVLYQKIGDRYMSHAVKFGGPWDKVIVEHDLAKRIQQLCLKLADIFDVVGMCRFDYVAKDDKIYFLEGNLVPSLAPGGSYNYMLKAAGVDFNDFIRDMIYSFENRVKNNKLLIYNAE
jgi:D-alanine-D-alanine ligase